MNTHSLPEAMMVSDEIVTGHRMNPEQEMWCAVIWQALVDATRTRSPSAMKSDRKGTVELDRARAVQWLLEDMEDFYEVCSLADMEPEAVRTHARRIIAEFERGQQ